MFQGNQPVQLGLPLQADELTEPQNIRILVALLIRRSVHSPPTEMSRVQTPLTEQLGFQLFSLVQRDDLPQMHSILWMRSILMPC